MSSFGTDPPDPVLPPWLVAQPQLELLTPGDLTLFQPPGLLPLCGTAFPVPCMDCQLSPAWGWNWPGSEQ